MPVFNIHHITKYKYDRPVKESVSEIRIYPFAGNTQETIDHQVFVSGQPEIFIIQDYWGNRAGTFNLVQPHTELIIDSKLIVRTLAPSNFSPENPAGIEALKKETANQFLLLELARLNETDLKEKLNMLVNEFYIRGMPVATIIEKCGSFIFQNFSYIKGITTIESTVEEILEHRSGVCQDFAHVMLEMLRSLEIPSRYVSGYVCPNQNGMRGEGATHAWIEAWVPGNGWIGYDPTNDVWAIDHHVKLAVGRHFNDCSPVKGTFKGLARHSLSVFVSIGYEDGQQIEEISEVKINALPGAEELPEYNEDQARQQQQ
ncbi:MAG: transglutaminase family protein [Chitinophagaceae bacterium]